jgi:hypothetical protein
MFNFEGLFLETREGLRVGMTDGCSLVSFGRSGSAASIPTLVLFLASFVVLRVLSPWVGADGIMCVVVVFFWWRVLESLVGLHIY